MVNTESIYVNFCGYLVSSCGSIYNKKGKKKYTWLNQGRESVYERVQLWICGSKKNYYVHRLVAMCFMSDFNESLVVNHIDGNSLNNQLSNLEMCTQSENVKHGYWFKELKLKKSKCIFKIGFASNYLGNSNEY